MNEKIYVTKPSMPSYEEFCEAIKPLWESKWLTNMGEYHNRLERELASYLDVPQISLMVNGHMALELALQSFDFPIGGEVITTPFTFVSTIHAITRNRLKPVFCDVNNNDGTIDESLIESLITEKTVAIVPVHIYGNICNVEEIQRIADKHNLKVVYDAAHAFGERYDGVGSGNFGDASVFSFHATKVFNTVEGGAVVCKSQEMYSKLYNLKNFGIRGEEVIESVGANAKMGELHAIMGLCNLKHIDEAIEKRREIHELYKEHLSEIQGIRPLSPGVNATRNYAYFPIIIEDDFRITRDELYKEMRDKNIYVRKYFYPLISEADCYKDDFQGCDTPVAENMSKRVLTLPIYETLDLDQVRIIIGNIIDG